MADQQNSKQLRQVLVLGPPAFFKAHDKQFSERFQILRSWESPIPLEQYLITHAGSIEAILCSGSTRKNADILRLLPSLSIIVVSSAGLNQIDLPECRSRGIAITNAGTVYSEDVADAAVGLLIDVLRKITAGDKFVRAGIWPRTGDYPLGKKLGGKRVGIVGLGSIGLEVTKRLEAFGCIISYHSRNKKPSVPFPFYPKVYDLAANCDILIICCALTHQTHHMINKEVFLALGKEGIIVNIARGAIIDEKDLVQCLLQGEIAGAGLDVFDNEPYVPRELFALDNVVLSPHYAVFTEESFRDSYELASRNLEAFFSNQPLLSKVLVDE